MPYELTGVSVPLGGLQWVKTEGDKEVARRVLVFLEDRRVLFGDRHCEDEDLCLSSVLQIREVLTKEIVGAKPGKELEATLRAMRGSCRKFVEAAGPDARNFRHRDGFGVDQFSLALGDLRTSIGHHLAVILTQYPQPVEADLRKILPVPDEPEQDLSWLP